MHSHNFVTLSVPCQERRFRPEIGRLRHGIGHPPCGMGRPLRGMRHSLPGMDRPFLGGDCGRRGIGDGIPGISGPFRRVGDRRRGVRDLFLEGDDPAPADRRCGEWLFSLTGSMPCGRFPAP